ncbi:hypothetical protein TNCV_984961 [Trichonephila clavipes]|nr:hypothetical protein TNCV_984961 [Trichonephila clavipes]
MRIVFDASSLEDGQPSLNGYIWSELKIPRKILDSSGDSSEVQIHTFSDASQKAYGAAAFLRVKHKGRIGTDDGRSACCTLSKGSQENPRSEVFNQSLFLTDSKGHLHWIKGRKAIDGKTLLREPGSRNPIPHRS